MSVFLGCGLEGLSGLSMVDAVISDLPSGETRAPFDNPPNTEALNTALWRALKPGGVAVLMAHSLPFAAELMRGVSHFRYEVVWEKTRATGFLNAKRRPLRCHEYVLVFYRKLGTYNPQMTQGHPPIHAATRVDGHGENYGAQGRVTRARAGATDRYPRSVLKTSTLGTTDKRRRHPQQKPQELLQWLVATYTNPGDLVVDPFAGSGSTGEACEAMGRRFIGWDSDPRFGGKGAA